MHNSFSLDGQWELSFSDPTTHALIRFPITVPGEAEPVLATQGLLGELFPPDRVDALDRVDSVNWVYSRTFKTPEFSAGDTVRLHFDGIDPAARIYLNGVLILETDNAQIAHFVDITSRLRTATANELKVEILTDIEAAEPYGPPAQDCGFGHPLGAFLRKARHVWGWDNAPALPARGIWRGVRLEILPPTGIEDLYCYTMQYDPKNDLAELGFRCSLRLPDREYHRYTLVAELREEGVCRISQKFPVQAAFAGTGRRSLQIIHPRLWWPSGYGEPFLYEFTLTLLRDGTAVTAEQCQFGIRELELVRTPTLDSEGKGEFVFICNGEKIYIRGTNWKVLDPLHSRAEERQIPALELAQACHCNMIRIWGGGIYERDSFFNWCDRHGMLVWQDFMFACEFPSHNELFEANVRREAQSVICALRNHPSLAIWCGDNESDNALLWGNYIPITLRPADNHLSRQILKEATRMFDPWRDYLESSPFIDDSLFHDRRSRRDIDNYLQRVPEQHYYASEADYAKAFDRSRARFISEAGAFYYNALSEDPAILARELPRIRAGWEKIPAVRELLLHQSENYLHTWCESAREHLAFYFGAPDAATPENPERLVEAINISVAENYKYAIESFRQGKFQHHTGMIWWSLCDMWPMAFNYSVADCNLRPKLPFYWIAAAQQSQVIIGKRHEDKIILYAINDTRQKFCENCRITSVDAELNEHEIGNFSFECPPNGNIRFGELPENRSPRLLLFHWGKQSNHLVAGRPPYSLELWRKWRSFLLNFYQNQ